MHQTLTYVGSAPATQHSYLSRYGRVLSGWLGKDSQQTQNIRLLRPNNFHFQAVECEINQNTVFVVDEQWVVIWVVYYELHLLLEGKT